MRGEKMKKKSIMALMSVIALGLTGCAGETAAEQGSRIAGEVVESVAEEATEVVAADIVAEDIADAAENAVADSTEENVSDASAEETASYADLIARVQKGLEEGFSDADVEEGFVSSAFFNPSALEYEILGYTYMDLNGDGQDELIFGENDIEGKKVGEEGAWDSNIYNIFTIKDGKIECVVEGWERNRYCLLQDGKLLNQASGGANDSAWTVMDYTADGLVTVETLFTQYDEEGNGKFYRTAGDIDAEGAEEVSEEELIVLIDSYEIQAIEFVPFVGAKG